jgi:hypothetical protein
LVAVYGQPVHFAPVVTNNKTNLICHERFPTSLVMAVIMQRSTQLAKQLGPMHNLHNAPHACQWNIEHSTFVANTQRSGAIDGSCSVMHHH